MKSFSTITGCLAVFFVLMVQPLTALAAFTNAGSIKGTVTASTNVSGVTKAPVSGAQLTLVNKDLPNQSIKISTDDSGSFVLAGLPAATYVLSVDAAGLQSVQREIRLTEGAAITVEIELTSAISESVTVRDEEGLLSIAETSTSNIVREQTLKNLPLRAENYQSALPLTPGVVRDSSGLDHIKGARAGQSAYTVNGADVTDPLTGNLAFDVPIEAAASVQIEENPYSAEFGRLTGGAINLETKGGGDKFKFTAARFFPTFRYIIGGPIDSFRPRLTFSGPLIRNRLYFLQSVEYRFSRVRVPSLPALRRDSTSEAFNSFTQFDLNVNKNNRIKFVAAIFPQKARYVGLNTFNPQETTPNINQRGALFSISEQAIFGDASFISSTLSYKTSDLDAFGQGAQPLTLMPDGNTGNYFADTRRRTKRLQWQEIYYARPFSLGGQHSIKVGGELNRTNVSSRFRDNSILIRRSDGTLAQQIDFANTGSLQISVGEAAAFVQDRWVINPKLTIDAGMRFDRDGIAKHNNIAPRLSFLLLPLKDNRTIIRGGIGLFYDRSPLSTKYFEQFDAASNGIEGSDNLSADSFAQLVPSSPLTHLPQRIVTTFAADGRSIVDGPRQFRNRISSRLRDPRSLRWNLQLDRGITKNLTARIGYLDRSTTDDLIVKPRVFGADRGSLRLSSTGQSRYQELQLLANYNNPRMGDWKASYVWSRARGDLNTADNFLSDLPAFVIRRNEYGPLPFDAPHRFLIYGSMKMRGDINISPALEVRSGFPFSIVNEQLDFVGLRNQAGRFPTFISLDTQVTKGFRLPKSDKKARIGVAVFNITNHFNPRDVQNNLGSKHFGQFFNGLGTSLRGKFELDF